MVFYPKRSCSYFLWIAFDSLDLWPGSTLLDYISPDILILFISWFHPLSSMGFEPSCGLFCGNPNLELFPHALCEAELGPGYMCICCRFFFLFSVACLWYIQICFCYAVKWIFLSISSFLDQFFHFWLEIFSCYSESLEDKILIFVVWCHSSVSVSYCNSMAADWRLVV